jgi:gliding motility-associated-like protein
MTQYKKLLSVLIAFLASLSINAQTSELEQRAMYVFPSDSLTGFDEQAASASALENGAFGKEFKVFMYREKRNFIIQKYGIKVIQPVEINNFTPPVYNYKLSSMPSSGACNNEDFEDATSNNGPQVGGVVNGWSLFGGTGANYCSPVANGATSTYTVYNAPTIDNIMVAPNNTVASYFDANNVNQPAGSCFIRLNNANAGGKVIRASKTYTINPNNALFRYAYRAVISDPNHGCCDQPGFHIKVTITNTATSQSTLLACPNISVAAGTACTGSATPGFVTGNNLNGSPSRYNPNWVPGAIDLSSYIGFAVTLNVFAIDCSLSGHAGYVYFDALCAPMTIIGNGQGFPAGTSSIILPTCGASGATVTAPPGLGPYSWNSSQISIPASYAVPSNTNQTLLTNQSGTLQLTMNPPGSCNPINKIITVTITPAPVVVASATQASCTNSLSVASLTTSGSASVNPMIFWSPQPASVAGNSLSASGLAIGVTTITVADNFSCQATTTINILPAPPPVTFSVVNNTGSFSLTCLNPTINMGAVTNYTYGSLTYTWSSISFTSNGTTVGITQPGDYTVCASDVNTGCITCETFTILQNISIPSNTITNPTSNILTCNNTAAPTFTSSAITPTVNIIHNWFSPLNPYPVGPPVAADNNTTSIYVTQAPGIYTVQFCNLVNGCCNTKTIEVQSLTGFPSFNTSSTSNYSIGCSTTSMTTLCFQNGVSSTSAGVTYAFLPPGTPSAVPIPTTAFGAASCTNITVPGTWTLVIRDVGNDCQVPLSVPILQNTLAPHVDVDYAPVSQTLTCFNPTILATGTSSTPGTSVTWIVPSTPPNLSTNTVVLGPSTGPITSTTNLTYANYTVVATNSVNACRSTSVVVVNQNFRIPTPLTAIGNPSVINCFGNPVVLSYTNNAANSGMPGAVGIVQSWTGPAPQTTYAAQQYSAYVPGTYTLTVMDSKNGCIGTRTVTIQDATQPPVLANPVATATLDCGAGTGSSALSTNMQVALSAPLSNWSVLFYEYPTGASFNPLSAITPTTGMVSTGSLVAQNIATDVTGQYVYLVRNNTTGCVTVGTINVVPGGLNADFTPNVTSGFAPLAVEFTNNSSTSTGASSITSVWSFGNGTSQTTTTSINTAAVYNSPGTYTVMMISSKGTCVDTAYKVINVDIPSKLEIPNVFSPNGDGSNDVFYLKTANLTEITAIIFDRWGNKVYEVTSSTGNIAWDGKNLSGKDVAAGTYFYMIKATGKDGQTYDQKGNVSLYR